MQVNKKQKVLYISKDDFPWDIRTDKICSSLSDNFEVYLLCRKQVNSLNTESYNNFTIKRFSNPFLPKLLNQPIPNNPIWRKVIKKNVEEIKPNIIIVREMHLASIATKIGSRYNIPVIMDMAENYPAAIQLWKKYNNSVLKRLIFHKLKLANIIEKYSLKNLTAVITVCDEQHNRVQSLTPFPLKFITIYNTPKPNTFTKKESSSLPIQNKEKQTIVFGHHGHLTAEKSIDNLIKAFALLSEQNFTKHINFHLLIAGSGECLQDLKNLSIKLGIMDKITFTGTFNYLELNDLLAQVDVGVIPYPPNDFNNFTIHNKIFDYFAKGIPVISSEAIPNALLVKQTNSGIVVNCSNPTSLAKAMANIIDDNYQIYADNAYNAFTQTYNWEQDSDRLNKFLSSLVAQ